MKNVLGNVTNNVIGIQLVEIQFFFNVVLGNVKNNIFGIQLVEIQFFFNVVLGNVNKPGTA